MLHNHSRRLSIHELFHQKAKQSDQIRSDHINQQSGEFKILKFYNLSILKEFLNLMNLVTLSKLHLHHTYPDIKIIRMKLISQLHYEISKKFYT